LELRAWTLELLELGAWSWELGAWSLDLAEKRMMFVCMCAGMHALSVSCLLYLGGDDKEIHFGASAPEHIIFFGAKAPGP
jgi:hypothetical protein